MLTPQDIADVIRRRLNEAAAGASSNKSSPYEPKNSSLKPVSGRPFLTEYVIKKALTPGTLRITIPQDAIISPLAQDWLILKGIQVVRSA